MRVWGTTWGIVGMALAGMTSAAGAQPSETLVRGEIAARVDSFLTRAAAYELGGSIVVAQHGKVLLRKGYGFADRESSAPITPETPFFIGSLAKQFTAAAILRLEADGKLALSDSLGRFFPETPADKRAVTVRQLLSHTAGLPYLPAAGLFGSGTRDSVMQEMLAESMVFRPGQKYEYSTPGYILLAGIIERASGESYEQYMRSIFHRAQLHSTGFVGERARWSITPVRSYSDATTESWLADVPALPRFVGAGSIVSTVADLYRWYEALVAGRVVPDAQRDELFAPVVPLRPNLEEALTWMIVTLPTGTLRQAAGDIGGFNAELRHYVDEELVVAFASNARVRGRGYRELVMNYVARMSRGEQIPLPPAVASMASEDLDSLPGKYSLAGGGLVEIWSAHDSLMIGASDSAALAMLAGHDSASGQRASELSVRAARFLSALDSGSSAQEYMHASIPTDSRRAYLAKLRAMLGDSLASRTSVIGTAVDSPNNARSYVTLRTKGRSEILSLVWSGGMLVGLEPGGRAAYALRLRPEGRDELAAFDLFTGHLVRVGLLARREIAIESNGVRRRAAP